MKKVVSLFLVSLFCVMLNANAIAAAPVSDSEGTAYLPSGGEYTDENFYGTDELQVFANGAIRVYPTAKGTSDSEASTAVERALYSQRATGPIAGMLTNAGDAKSYTIEVDYSVVSEVILCAFPFLTTKDFTISIYRESTQTTSEITTQLNTVNFIPKTFISLLSKENTTETYTISIIAQEDVTGYAFTLGEKETFADDFGGGNTYPTIPKNNPCEEPGYITNMPQFIKGYQALLNTGEWFHYVADGETYITAEIMNRHDLAFDVYELDTGIPVATTKDTAHVVSYYSNGEYLDVVQMRLDLEVGKDYVIRFYSTSYVPVSDEDLWNSLYTIWIGLPYFKNQSVSYTSPAYSLPKNTTRTFTFDVSGFPDSMRADDMTRFNVKGSSTGGISATSCRITAPNGYTFTAPYGSASGLPFPTLYNYLDSPSNIPINGTWKVTVSSIKDIPNLRFYISGAALQIVGNHGN